MPPKPPSFTEALRVWTRIGVISFGGPAGQIALMHRELVEERDWMSERDFLDATAFCMLLPGPEAMQIATYAGWRLHGLKGGLAAGLLFILPGAFVIMALAAAYAAFGTVPLVAALFLGIKAAVVVIVIEALLKVSRKALTGADRWTIAALAFVGIFFLAVPFPLIVLGAAIYGFVTARGAGQGVAVTVTPAQTLRTVAVWSVIWAMPIIAVFVFAPDTILPELGLFFSKLAVVTFGGAYAVLAYMAQDVVTGYGWLSAGEMLDGLGLAETTPGPLILVTEFVGYLAGQKTGIGITAAALTLWVTFVPCFLWIFTFAPYIAWITAQPKLKGALSAITAAVVGVILNLSIWFALNVFFGQVTQTQAGPLTLWLPAWPTLQPAVPVLAALAALLLLRFKAGLGLTLLVSALGGVGWSFASGAL